MAVSINGTNGLTFNDGSSQSAASLGYGQTWQDVTASRASGTTYTNSTGKPIMVALSFYLVHDRTVTATVSGVNVLISGSPADDSWHNITFLVPNNATYIVTQNGWGSVIWTELR